MTGHPVRRPFGSLAWVGEPPQVVAISECLGCNRTLYWTPPATHNGFCGNCLKPNFLVLRWLARLGNLWLWALSKIGITPAP